MSTTPTLWDIPTPDKSLSFSGKPGASALVNRGRSKPWLRENIAGRTWRFSHATMDANYHGWWVFWDWTERDAEAETVRALVHPREFAELLEPLPSVEGITACELLAEAATALRNHGVESDDIVLQRIRAYLGQHRQEGAAA